MRLEIKNPPGDTGGFGIFLLEIRRFLLTLLTPRKSMIDSIIPIRGDRNNPKLSVTDPKIENVLDRPYNLPDSRLIDRRVVWLDAEGFTSSKCGGVK